MVDSMAGQVVSLMSPSSPVFVIALVYEKNKLRPMMQIGGLSMPVYFGVMFGLFLCEYLVMVFAFYLLLTAIVPIAFFHEHSPFLMFIFVLTWGVCLVSFSFFASTFFSSSRTAGVVMGFGFLFVGDMASRVVLFQWLMDPDVTSADYFMFQWIPMFAMYPSPGTTASPRRWGSISPSRTSRTDRASSSSPRTRAVRGVPRHGVAH